MVQLLLDGLFSTARFYKDTKIHTRLIENAKYTDVNSLRLTKGIMQMSGQESWDTVVMFCFK